MVGNVSKILVEKTKILFNTNCKRWLQFLEAILMENWYPTLNKISFSLRAGIFKCTWYKCRVLLSRWIHSHVILSCYLNTFKPTHMWSSAHDEHFHIKIPWIQNQMQYSTTKKYIRPQQWPKMVESILVRIKLSEFLKFLWPQSLRQLEKPDKKLNPKSLSVV